MKIFLITLLILNLDLAYSQKYNRPVPPAAFPFEFLSHQSLEDGYFLTAPLKLNSQPKDRQYISTKPTVLDKNGFVFWYMEINAANTTDFKYFPKDSMFAFIKTNDGLASYHLMDLHFNLIDSFTNTNNIKSDAHEIQRLSNGNYIIGGTKDTLIDLSSLTFDGKYGNKKTVTRGYVIQEFNKEHKLVFQWNSNNHIHPKESYESYGYDSTKYDYAHGNSIEEDTDGHLLISLRYLNAIYKINHQTGKVIWKFGGKSSDFKFTNDEGFSGQHDVRRLPNGHISLFDNANTAKAPKTSRAVQYKIDTANRTATKIWDYVQPFFVTALGGYHTTNTNCHLVNNGLSFRPHPSISLIDENKKPVATIIYPDSVMCYRSFYFEKPFDIKQERIQVSGTGNQTILMAPNGFKKYLWSTGDTTQFIIVSKQLTYQVWMNYGEGMIGSHPLTLQKYIKNDFWILEQNGTKVTLPQKGKTYHIKTKNGSKKTIIWQQ